MPNLRIHTASAWIYAGLVFGAVCQRPLSAQTPSRYATSDSLAGYVHWIDLYDDANQRIDPIENPRPYSPANTCGRCHDFKAISHGWHFSAASPTNPSDSGRSGQPLIWSDPRTGTFLPLSYRGWKGSFKPSDLGLTNWQVAAKLGGYLPGVSPDTPQSFERTILKSSDRNDLDVNNSNELASARFSVDRSHLTGTLPIDCLLCHHRPGSGYSPFVWTEQIAEQNFAYAPTAALGIAVVTGGMRRLKDDFDPSAESSRDQLPKVEYEARQFRSDGKVFIDLVRRPRNDSCYYCHTELTTGDIQGSRWLHDQDVHLRAGMLCVDCHRNGLDHQTVRGFEGENHGAGSKVEALSCRGCHLGDGSAEETNQFIALSGQLGAPRPTHRGLPPIHLEKLSCTACHSGPVLESDVERQFHSIGHELGRHVKRKGNELPGILGNVMIPVDWKAHAIPADAEGGKYTPLRFLWPSYWALLKDGKIEALNPEQAYELVRRPLKVRRDFVEDLSELKLSLAQRREILGDDREARKKLEELSDEQRQKIESAESLERSQQVEERMLDALAALETEHPSSRGVFISGGTGFARSADGKLTELSGPELGEAASPYTWPAAHGVRPARQSLGATGCNECHSKDSAFFFAEVLPVGVLPGQKTPAIAVHQLQRVDTERLAAWSQLFEGRSRFKTLGLAALGVTAAIVILSLSVRLTNLFGRRPAS